MRASAPVCCAALAKFATRGALAALVAGPLAAQPSPRVQVDGPASNPILDGVATFTIHTFDFGPDDLPLRLQLQVSTSPDFAEPLFADTTVTGSTADIVVPRLLPDTGALYWRAIALTNRAGSVPSPITGPRTPPTHLRLISPNNTGGQSLNTRHPVFVWRGSAIPPSAGRWDYELRVEATATGVPVIIARTGDTTHTVNEDRLEANSSYRWRVRATYSATGEQVEVASFASFVILSDDAPLTTILLTPFPNPFPSPTSPSACIWFDLRAGGPVALDILDSRGLLVKRIAPGPQVGGTLVPGRYGRPAPGAPNGCDDRFSWDGTDARGRTVPSGLYLVRLRADGRSLTQRILFRGR